VRGRSEVGEGGRGEQRRADGDVLLCPNFVRVAGGAYDCELRDGEEGVGGGFGGHFEGSCLRVIKVWRWRDADLGLRMLHHLRIVSASTGTGRKLE
jgi:hypothetical protein